MKPCKTKQLMARNDRQESSASNKVLPLISLFKYDGRLVITAILTVK